MQEVYREVMEYIGNCDLTRIYGACSEPVIPPPRIVVNSSGFMLDSLQHKEGLLHSNGRLSSHCTESSLD